LSVGLRFVTYDAMFTDAGAHLMQYTQQAMPCQTTDRRAYTLFSG